MRAPLLLSLCALLTCVSLFSEEAATPASKQILLIKGILLTANREAIVQAGRTDVTGIQTEAITIPGGTEGVSALLNPYLGKELTRDELLNIKRDLMRYYREKMHPLVMIEVPKQNISAGSVQILITEQRIGKVIKKGNRWWSDELMDRYVHIDRGQFSEDVLLNDLSWLNNNPFHRTEVKYIPTEDPGVVDLELTSKERFPLRVYARAENTGNKATGEDRYAAGFSWGNAFCRNDILSYEYMTSNHFSRVHSHMASYTSFLKNKNILLLYGSYARVHPQITNFHSTLKNTQAKLRYTMPFKPLYKPLSRDITAGLDYKNVNSNLISVTQGEVVTLPSPPVLQNVNITQVMASYNRKNTIKKHQYWTSIEAYVSPGQILPDQSNSDFNKLRPHSKNTYGYLYLTLGDTLTLNKNFSVSGLLRAQAATSTLPPTEEFGLGGYATVRGYREREFNSDNGLITNLELRSPPIQFFCKVKDQLIFLAFMDFGLGNNYHVRAPTTSQQKHEPHTQYLWSIGPGLRYTINPYLSLRADYGYKLHTLFSATKQEESFHKGTGKFHFGLLLSY